MSMKKKITTIISILLLVSMPFLLVGCMHNDDEETPVGTTSVVPSDQQITLIWWNLFESQENVQPLIDAYQAIHPNVTIEYSEKSIEDYQVNLDKVLTDGQPATTPDIFTIHNTWVGRYESYLIAAPGEVIDAATYESSFYSVINSNLIMDGVPRAISLGVDSIALIYNKDLFSAKGYTTPSNDWAELFEQAKNLTKETDGKYTTSGMSLGASDASEAWFDVFNLLLMQSDVQMLNTTEDAAIFADDAATVEAVDYFKSFESEGIWDESLKTDVALFLDGELAMLMAPSWRLLDIIAYNETYDLGIDYGIAAVPQLSSLESEKVGWVTYWAQGVSIDSQNYKVAWDFLNFATQPDQLRLEFEHNSQSRAYGQIYPRVGMKVELENDENLSVYLNEISTAKTWNMVDGAQVKETFAQWLSNELDADGAQTEVTGTVGGQGRL